MNIEIKIFTPKGFEGSVREETFLATLKSNRSKVDNIQKTPHRD
jgi:hypothetical protein